MINELIINGVAYGPERIKPTPKSFTEVLKAFRASYRWSLDEAAGRAGISKTYLWELESGTAKDPSLRVAAMLAKVYNVDLQCFADALLLDHPCDLPQTETEEVKP
jgi:transcriptional regulator with XRE-family HTH domain